MASKETTLVVGSTIFHRQGSWARSEWDNWTLSFLSLCFLTADRVWTVDSNSCSLSFHSMRYCSIELCARTNLLSLSCLSRGVCHSSEMSKENIFTALPMPKKTLKVPKFHIFGLLWFLFSMSNTNPIPDLLTSIFISTKRKTILTGGGHSFQPKCFDKMTL